MVGTAVAGAVSETRTANRVLEVGFGRGLNTAMALRLLSERGFGIVGESASEHGFGVLGGLEVEQVRAKPDANERIGNDPVCIQAYGCEPNPHFLAKWPELPEELAGFAPWWGYTEEGEWRLNRPSCPIEIHQTTAAELLAKLPKDSIDWIFLDLFSPAKHEEDWQPELWAGLAKVASFQAVLTSYCCARRVRNGLQNVGWRCQVLRRAGYRDTLRARFLAVDDRNA